jgi:hypothetical protein
VSKHLACPRWQCLPPSASHNGLGGTCYSPPCPIARYAPGYSVLDIYLTLYYFTTPPFSALPEFWTRIVFFFVIVAFEYNFRQYRRYLHFNTLRKMHYIDQYVVVNVYLVPYTAYSNWVWQYSASLNSANLYSAIVHTPRV